MQTPKKQGKKKSLIGSSKEQSELDLLRSYRRRLGQLGVMDDRLSTLDLDNEFFWLFRLTGLIAKAYHQFEQINERHFASRLLRPRIIFCNRSSGGYYHRARHTIGISLAMTVEFGETEFFETLLHEIAHILVHSHSAKFYEVLSTIGGSGKKAPLTLLLAAKRKRHRETRYPIVVQCPNCLTEQRYRTKRALKYACKPCCTKFAGGKYDERFRFRLALRPDHATS